ncbi:23S rRNA (adenine(1618)-N(6))-methyltransferase [Vibrio rumoiensis 1S-45]|uniref:Ribosomal RNA large subunit methyltransferase F n=1 Tax=Vibrio rumoiensis 1S-45 TaxID=1188252 RepID=A0A1E5E493_9VIBR|nr:23S rRNA (adenine(1618)-N(6))-methyltransferase [Vibrio rumoiensis 1S-45]
MHARNIHKGRYDFEKLEKANPNLTPFVILNPRGEKSVNFSEPKAVVALNEALLKAHYGVEFWQIPEGYLCPPIPGRVDYIHYLADLLTETVNTLPEVSSELDELAEEDIKGSANHKYSVLDIGAGANCIYPILGATSYDWNFVGSDIDPVSVKTAQLLIQANRKLKNKIKLRLQNDANCIFSGIIKPQDTFALTMCNPPFHESLEKATEGSLRKVRNLNKSKDSSSKSSSIKADGKPVLNFAGTENELCYEGGEIAFLKLMANESLEFSDQVCWFTSLVSKQENVPLLEQQVKNLGAKQVKVIHMSQGQKMTRFVAWTFLSAEEKAEFFDAR